MVQDVGQIDLRSRNLCSAGRAEEAEDRSGEIEPGTGHQTKAKTSLGGQDFDGTPDGQDLTPKDK